MVVIGVIASAIAIPLALIIPWFPSKASVQAGNIRTLYDVLLITTIPIFVLVETVVLFSVWKFRMRPGQEEMDGPPIHGNTRLEVVWTAVPAILIVSLCAYAYSVLRTNEANKTNAMTVNVTTRQFAFEFSYPQSPGKQVVSSELYLPEGRPVVFKLRSLDVIHSFFVPNFSEKLDAVPGIVTTVRVTPDVLGTYPVECTELCGAGHSLMRSSAHVLTPAAFASWLKSQPINGPPPVGTPPATVTQAVPDYDAERAERQRLFVGGAVHVVVILELVQHQRRRRPGRVHGLGGVQRVPHAGGGVGHRDGRAQSRCQASDRLREPRLREDPRHDTQAMHRDRDHQALRVPADRLQRGNHAVELRSAAHAGPDPGARQLPLERGQVSGRDAPARRYRPDDG